MSFLLGINYVLRIIYAVAIYAASAYSLYIIARRNAVPCPFLAFVPIVQFYIIGSICEEYVLWGYRIRKLAIVMCLLVLVRALSGIVTGMSGFAFNLVSTILMALILHKFFYLFKPQHALIFAILSLFDMLPIAIILFFIKDMPMQMSAGAYPYPFANKPR